MKIVLNENIKRVLNSIDGDVIVGYGNYGYRELAHNWFNHIKKVGLSSKVIFFCLDERMADYCKENMNGCKYAIWKSEQYQAKVEACYFQNDTLINDWSEIVAQKLEIVSTVLSLGKNVLYADNDIVFLQPHFNAKIKPIGKKLFCVFSIIRLMYYGSL